MQRVRLGREVAGDEDEERGREVRVELESFKKQLRASNFRRLLHPRYKPILLSQPLFLSRPLPTAIASVFVHCLYHRLARFVDPASFLLRSATLVRYRSCRSKGSWSRSRTETGASSLSSFGVNFPPTNAQSTRVCRKKALMAGVCESKEANRVYVAIDRFGKIVTALIAVGCLFKRVSLYGEPGSGPK